MFGCNKYILVTLTVIFSGLYYCWQGKISLDQDVLKLNTRSIFVLSLCIFLSWYFLWHGRAAFDPAMLKNKVIVICGASSGIGEEMAYQYSKLGARLILAARREERLQKVKAKCQELGSPDVHFVVSDLSNPESTNVLKRETINYFGEVDILVLNHVTFPTRSFWNKHDLINKEIHEQLQVNVVSYLELAKVFTPHLVASSGNIVVVSSGLSHVRAPRTGLYSPSKSATHNFFESYRAELLLQGFGNVSITICDIGGLNNSDLPGIDNSFMLGTVENCVEAIIKHTATRKEILYFPSYVRVLHWAGFLSSKVTFTIMYKLGILDPFLQ